MSFILDALKKSESERHRHSGPVLMDVRIAPPRRRLPVWAWVIAGVLLVNLLLLAWVLWLSPDHRAAVPVSAAVAPANAPQVVAPAAAPVMVPPAAAPQAAAPVIAPAPTISATAPVVETAPPATNTYAQPSSIPAPAALGTPPANTAPIDINNLPRVQDLIAAGAALPELRLSLHVFDPAPTNRYVLLNGARLREGESTAEGVKVLQIAPAGAVLEWRGRRMFLGTGG